MANSDVLAAPTLELGKTLRKTVLVTHIVSAGAWIGIDVIVAVLVVIGFFGTGGESGLAYQALGTFVVTPMLASGLVCLASGVVLGLGTRYGLIRYWWVLVKLGLNSVLCALIYFVLRPGMAEVAEYGRALSEEGNALGDVSTLFFPPAVSLSALTLATVLAVFKPWGRVRRA